MMKAAGFSETQTQTCQTTRHYVAEDPSLCTHHQKNICISHGEMSLKHNKTLSIYLTILFQLCEIQINLKFFFSYIHGPVHLE